MLVGRGVPRPLRFGPDREQVFAAADIKDAIGNCRGGHDRFAAARRETGVGNGDVAAADVLPDFLAGPFRSCLTEYQR
jgi:hypothetical protein